MKFFNEYQKQTLNETWAMPYKVTINTREKIVSSQHEPGLEMGM